jgi:hypothetical protein
LSLIAASAKSAGTPNDTGYDTITEGITSKLTADTILASGEKGKLILTVPLPGKQPVPDGIEVQQNAALSIGTDREDLESWLFNDQ